jgi:hypothetical protein
MKSAKRANRSRNRQGGSRETPFRNPAAVALGRMGGVKGGKARMAQLSPRERSELGRKAAVARWDKKKK